MNTHKTWPLAFKIKLRISKVERHPKEADKRLKRSVWITATPPARLVRSGRWRKENPGGRASTEGTQSPAESQASVITKKPMFSVIIKSWQIKASLASERTLVPCSSPDINSIPTERTGDRSRRITPFHSNSDRSERYQARWQTAAASRSHGRAEMWGTVLLGYRSKMI